MPKITTTTVPDNQRLTSSENEITHRGYQDANQALQQLNQDLNVMNRQVEYEREQSEGLLLNILPKPIADRIKHGEVHLVDYFSNVSVMFADIVGFTGLSRPGIRTRFNRLA